MIKKILIDGLKFLIPVGVTVLVLFWLITWVEKILGDVILGIIGDQYDFPGIGLLFGLVLVIIFGLILQISYVRTFLGKILDAFMNLPVIRMVYRVSSDVFSFFQEDNINKGRVVMVDTSAGKVMGILTREEFDGLPDGYGKEGEAAVYLPMSYQIGGFTTVVPKESLEYVDMSTEDAFSLIMSAGVSKRKSGNRELS